MDQHTQSGTDGGAGDIITVGSLCTGGRGLERSIELLLPAAVPIFCVEWEAFAAENLVAALQAEGMGEIPVWSNVKTFDGKPWRGLVDILTAGYPCQPFSQSGLRRGADDPRHLWPDIARIIGEIQPRICWFENVEGHLTLGLDIVLRDLQAMGRRTAVGLFSARQVGASHVRKRVFILSLLDDACGDSISPRWPQGVCINGNTGQGSSDAGGALAEGMAGGVGDVQCAERGQGLAAGCGAGNGQDHHERGAEGAGGVAPPDQRLADAVAYGRCACGRRHQPFGGPDQRTAAGWSGQDVAGSLADVQRAGLEGQPERVDAEGWQKPIGSVGPGSREFPLFTPGPAAFDTWLECLLHEPGCAPALTSVQLLAHGLASDRTGWLRLAGNGVVPLEGAYAFATLWSCLRV